MAGSAEAAEDFRRGRALLAPRLGRIDLGAGPDDELARGVAHRAALHLDRVAFGPVEKAQRAREEPGVEMADGLLRAGERVRDDALAQLDERQVARHRLQVERRRAPAEAF